MLVLGWTVSGTCREATRAARLCEEGINAFVFNGEAASKNIADALLSATHILSTVAPTADGDPVLACFEGTLKKTKPVWLGYISTSSVYGNHDGAWVDETTPITPTDARGARRVEMEQAWSGLGLPHHIFRIVGIYGPGRNSLESLQSGKARSINKKDHVFCRIHRDDIVTALSESAEQPTPFEIYNIADDEPAPPQDVVAYAAGLMGISPPAVTLYEDAELTPMLKSFYGNNRRVSNTKMKKRLGVTLKHPTYREGLTALYKLMV